MKALWEALGIPFLFAISVLSLIAIFHGDRACADEAPPYKGCIALADLDKKLDEFRANGNEIAVEDLSTEESTRYVDMFVRLNHNIEGVTRVRIIHHGQKATDIMTIVADK